ncbi:hypothetical protein A6F53_00125 [Levilactobacillus brevis]|nr:hypothetical protein A6F53_00125 [Levilactobacillus brevis]ATU70650.1 hypothetical protein CT113_10070 [Levilactobacillus brevis]
MEGAPSEPLVLRKEKGFRAKEKDVRNFAQMFKGKAGPIKLTEFDGSKLSSQISSPENSGQLSHRKVKYSFIPS